MEASLLLIISQLICVAHGHLDGSEFGRHRTYTKDPGINELVVLDNVAKNRQIKQKRQGDWLVEESLEDILDIRRSTAELSMAFSLSMSISMSRPPIPTSPVVPSGPPITSTMSPASSSPLGLSGPSGPSNSSEPSNPSGPSKSSGPSNPSGPSKSSGPSNPSGRPSQLVPTPITAPNTTPKPDPFEPSGPFGPSGPPGQPVPSPISAPNSTPQPIPAIPINDAADNPLMEPLPSGLPTVNSTCLSTNTLKLGTAADESATPVSLDMSYTAESNNTFVEDFEAELVEEFIRTAVSAIFGCNFETTGKIASNTEEIFGVPCNPTMDRENECFILQTTFIIGVEGPVDTDIAAYEAYKAIQESMVNGTYTEAVPDVVFLEFLSPLPLIKPPRSGVGENSPDSVGNSDVQRDVDVNPWAISFSVASVMGGFVSLLLYARNRRSRQNRGARLDETTPWVSAESDAIT